MPSATPPAHEKKIETLNVLRCGPTLKAAIALDAEMQDIPLSEAVHRALMLHYFGHAQSVTHPDEYQCGLRRHARITTGFGELGDR